MDSPIDAAAEAALAARRRRAAEQLVRDQVVVQTFADLPTPSIRQKLAASHYQLASSVSHAAFAAVWRR